MYLSGVSRSLTHELIRHRHFSYSQLSQRYVPERDAAFVEPGVIAEDPELHERFLAAADAALAAYSDLLEGLEKKFDFLARNLEGKEFLHGDRFTVADAYLFTVLNWTNYLKIDLSRWKPLKSYLERIGSRPAVRDAMRAEGLLQ